MLSKHAGEELEPGGSPADSIYRTYSRCVECVSNHVGKSLLAPSGIRDAAMQKMGCGTSSCSDRRRGSLNQQAMLNVQYAILTKDLVNSARTLAFVRCQYRTFRPYFHI